MNEITNITTGAGLTMSSLEIAGLTGKRHLHILRDVRRMLADLGVGETTFGSTYHDETIDRLSIASRRAAAGMRFRLLRPRRWF